MDEPAGGFNLADIWEAVCDEVPDRTAAVCGEDRRTYAQLEERANRLAHAMVARGLAPGDHVALHLTNSIAYLEAMLACFKVRAVPINVNYRYVADELRHLLSDAGPVGVVGQPDLEPRLQEVAPGLPRPPWTIILGDDYERALAAAPPGRDFAPRSGDDRYVIYTGGTTGLPKGVVWRQDDAFFACIGGGDPTRQLGSVGTLDEVLGRITDPPVVFCPVAPLMHAAGQWTALSWLFAGGTVVLLPGPLDPVAVWRAIEREHINLVTVVGDAVVRPLIGAWLEHGPFDVSSLLSIGSGGAPLTPAVKDQLIGLLPAVAVVDGFGSSETGAQGSQRLAAGEASGAATVFRPYPTTAVLDDATRRPVAAGSGAIGRVALRGRIPLGYHRDPERTAETFVEVDGVRWVLTGDVATVDESGDIRLLGRGSGCINTGGEKVFPEEVEAVLKSHPAVYDAVVVGVDDDRWGQRVAAVVQPAAGATVTLDELAAHCRRSLAGYKVPRSLTVVPEVQRSPAGKADHRWARRVAGDEVDRVARDDRDL